MKKSVHDDLVKEYAKRLRSGVNLGQVFPWPVPECEFTESQNLMIKQAQDARAKLGQKLKSQPPAPPLKTVAPKLASPPPPHTKLVATKPLAPPAPAPILKTPSLSKLERMFFLQLEKCFFCGQKMNLADANIEHLHPLSLGGTRTGDNEVVCHKSLNETFGNLPLKQKFEFVLRAAGSFRCPKK
jgi:hypothetical protein